MKVIRIEPLCSLIKQAIFIACYQLTMMAASITLSIGSFLTHLA